MSYLITQIQFEDVGKLIQEEERSIILRRAMHSGKAFDFENYHRYDEVWTIFDLAKEKSI